ncbi:cell division protein FtsI/penicillin-binding protein 2 [Prauserella shujinwangii]|uniref:Cell division protein FtsI/penicillin-binding protein 2 n=1 Tax=Prauserella shujinwangii TaxID=1453103 RepID=A0A2T0M1D9_9PSEU|nr:penicillin-binding transpeptidase domain-containing protein [Prauserella shujinwangii]PRX50422.1 cell division protein FtsI/penicillin-binding protein 2 [Prauserella shujinwangii]
MRKAVLVGLTVLTAGALVTACSGAEEAATRSLESFVTAWERGSVPGHEKEYQEVTSGLGDRTPELEPGEVEVDGDRATAPVRVGWTLAPDVRWEYETTVALAKDGDAWRVDWSPATVEPSLRDGERLTLDRGGDSRGPILDGAGEPITRERSVVTVGVQPSRVESAEKLATALGRALTPEGVDTGDLPDRIREADPDAFVPVVTLRKERYLQLKPVIYDLPGTVFREESRVLAPTRDFARALLGSVGPVTKEDMAAQPGRFAIGDQVGHGGLQEQYDDRLRGTPGVKVTVERPSGASRVLFQKEAESGAAVRTTLDREVQNAADAAVAAGEKNAAVVAVRVSDGAVLAVANSPGAHNLALTAKVPPGSTFKAVTALGLLESGAVTLDSPVQCPPTMTVGGRSFKNAWDGGIPDATFREAFAESCNTAFALLAPKLGAEGLAEAAGRLGIGKQWDLGATAYTGSVATGADPVEQAAAAFGQGRTTVSPIAIAAATAGIARGQWQQPSLVTEPAPTSPAAEGPKLDQAAVGALRTAMREVVTHGSGRELASVAGGPVHGKTGTAEYGTEQPPRSHSWFTGWQGDIAFATFVEDGGNDVAQALAVTKRFLDTLQ